MKKIFTTILILCFGLPFAFSQSSSSVLYYSRMTSPNGAIWINDGDQLDSLYILNGAFAKPSHDGDHLLYMDNTGVSQMNFAGRFKRRDLATGFDTVLFNSSDYTVGYDMLDADSTIFYSYSCGMYNAGFNGNLITTYAFSSCYDDGPDIRQTDSLIVYHNTQASMYTMHYDGSARTPIPNTITRDVWPIWSPDGNWILFGRLDPTMVYYANFFKIKANGDSLTQLTNNLPTDTIYSANAAWSNSGNAFITAGYHNGHYGLLSIRADGTGITDTIPTTPGDRIYFISGTYDVTSHVGIKETTAAITFNLFPNPANSQLNISLSETIQNGTASIKNMLGQEMRKTSFNGNKLSIDVNFLQPGIYQLMIVEKTGAVSSKSFIKY